MKELFYHRAKENLQAAELLFNAGLYNASTNRAYYAMFHAAISFLYAQGIEPNIDHKNVLSMFINEFVNRKKTFPSNFKKMIYEMQGFRNEADYKSGVGKGIASKQLKHTNEIINELFKELSI